MFLLLFLIFIEMTRSFRTLVLFHCIYTYNIIHRIDTNDTRTIAFVNIYIGIFGIWIKQSKMKMNIWKV